MPRPWATRAVIGLGLGLVLAGCSGSDSTNSGTAAPGTTAGRSPGSQSTGTPPGTVPNDPCALLSAQTVQRLAGWSNVSTRKSTANQTVGGQRYPQTTCTFTQGGAPPPIALILNAQSLESMAKMVPGTAVTVAGQNGLYYVNIAPNTNEVIVQRDGYTVQVTGPLTFDQLQTVVTEVEGKLG